MMTYTRDDLENAELVLIVHADGAYKWSSDRTAAEVAAHLRGLADDIAEHVVYEVGMPDPTTGLLRADCPAQSADGFACTWPAGHDHPQHVAGAITGIAHVWPVA